jgi:radical SAM superfamily enzyme YgiQ (UPF0313 family)
MFDTLFREMPKAGWRTLYFDIESASRKALDYYRKGIIPNQSIEASRLARRAALDVNVGSVIFGCPK